MLFGLYRWFLFFKMTSLRLRAMQMVVKARPADNNHVDIKTRWSSRDHIAKCPAATYAVSFFLPLKHNTCVCVCRPVAKTCFSLSPRSTNCPSVFLLLCPQHRIACWPSQKGANGKILSPGLQHHIGTTGPILLLEKFTQCHGM